MKDTGFFAYLSVVSPVTKLVAVIFFGLVLIPSIIQHSGSIFSNYFCSSASCVASNATGNVSFLKDSDTLGTLNDTINDGTIRVRSISAPVDELLRKIRAATLAAAGGLEPEFSEYDEEQWNLKNPCRSRSELNFWYERRKYVDDIPQNWQWEIVFREYAKLHRACMRGVGNITHYLSSGNKSSECRFLVGEVHFGLGNKILHLTSSFMFAVLSQRVLLASGSGIVPAVMCEPFIGSSWTTDKDFDNEVKRVRKRSGQFYTAVDSRMKNKRTPDIDVSGIDDTWGPENRFFCDAEQRFLTNVTWLTLDGCVYFLPKLYTIPSFRTTMESLFPERITLPVLLRSLMLPVDLVWERIVEVAYGYLGNAEMQVGIQNRYPNNIRQYNHDHLLVNERVTRCVIQNNILPDVCKESEGKYGKVELVNCTRPQTSQPRIVKVLVTSLYTGLTEHLRAAYLRHVTVTGDAVTVVQLTHENVQKTGVEVDNQALVEMLALSFSDTLLITPFSTFGHVAAAYGGLKPWFINHNSSAEDRVACQRTISREPCYLGGKHVFECKYNPGFEPNTSVIYTNRYLSTCMPIEQVDSGLLLLTTEE